VLEEEESPFPRFASRGRTYVYVLPCRDEDILKVGFSRNPLQRLTTLHSRFFRFFDLDRALLIHTDRLRDARRIERRFITTFAEARAPAPLVVPDAAAGYTEWYRGVFPEVIELAHSLCTTEGYALIPLKAWLRDLFRERADLLYAWSAKMLEIIEYERFNLAPGFAPSGVERALKNTLDAYAEIGLPVDNLVPVPVFRWHQNNVGGSA